MRTKRNRKKVVTHQMRWIEKHSLLPLSHADNLVYIIDRILSHRKWIICKGPAFKKGSVERWKKKFARKIINIGE